MNYMETKNREISYSMGGIPQYYSSLSDLIEFKITPNIEQVIINTSLQPNGIPHFGTIITLIGAFSFAKLLKQCYKVDAKVEVDYIECAPNAEYHKSGGEYCYSIRNTKAFNDGVLSVFEYNVREYYEPLLKWIAEESKVAYTIRTYQEYQALSVVRTSVISIYKDIHFFSSLLSPQSHKLHLRTECPICKKIDKNMKNTRVKEVTQDSIIIESFCDKHGKYEIEFTESNNTYVELNTQLRDITKGVLMNEYYNKNILGIMFDGGDWGGTWTQHIHCMALQRLKVDLPIRLFSPLVVDWSGGKISKSIYQKSKFENCYCFENYKNFVETYGESGLRKIYNEVESWIHCPAKFFRNYSLEYIMNIIER